MRVLIGHIERVFVTGTVVAADRRPGLECIGHEPIVHQVERGDMGRICEGSIHLTLVSNRPLVAVVVGGLIVEGGRAGRLCVSDIDHGRQVLIVHLHELGRIAGLLKAVCNHHCDMVADISHLALSQDGVGGLLHGLAIGAGDEPATGQSAHFIGGNIIAIKDSEYARCGQCRSLLNATNAGMRVRRAHEDRIGHIGQPHIIGVLPCTSQKSQVFFSKD
jgi:hypothetical protein